MRLTKEKINEIKDFIKSSIEKLTKSDWSCCKYDLDNELALFVGWSGGYGESDKDLYHNKYNKGYCLNVGIKIRNDFYWCDFDYLDFVADTNGTDVYDTDITLSKNENLHDLARYYIKEYNNIRRLINKEKLSIDIGR